MNLSRFFIWVGIFVGACALPACNRDSGKIRVAFVTNNSHGFWKYAEAGCKQAGRDLDVEVEFRTPPEGTSSSQKQTIEQLMDKGIKGIAISPNDPGNFVSFLKTEVNARIPLVMADNDLPDPTARRCYIGTDNYKAGRALGALVKKSLGKGKIAIFVGQMDATNAIERRQGVLDFLAGKSQTEMKDVTPAAAKDLAVGDYILVDTRTDNSEEPTCQRRAEDLLSIRSDVDCLIGLWEYNPPALLRAVRDSKLAKKPLIAGFDENFATLEGIKSGEIIGTVVQDPYQFGYQSIKILAGLAKGDDSVLKRPDIDSDKRIYIPHRIIVKTAGQEQIGDSATIDVDFFFPLLKKLRGE